ncbi:unnamed protein product [Phytophthora fragariaefolia]|uniref:Unnamed protein product n=1 Tax=Phytophthora fragariaefolia TaxID=1490495 RepID=A0A9W7D1Z2_9STRA|nr:unnamed protein product [Phytophthora fragariaefolia]
MTVQRYKKQIRGGDVSMKTHGNSKNKNASVIDLSWLTSWFKEFASEVGDVVPVRTRLKKLQDGKLRKYYSSEEYTFLPAFFTWDRLHEEMREFVELSRIRRREPAKSTMRMLLSLHCPNIRIRSPRDNVCDVCSIYLTKMRHGGTTADTSDELGRHTEAARRMRYAIIFIRGHTKNACDRGFGQIRNHMKRVDCWAVEDVVTNAAAAAKTSSVKHVQRRDDLFKGFKPLLNELYKPLSAVQRYHIFSMTKESLGVVSCKTGPDDTGTSEDVRRKFDKTKTTASKVKLMFEQFLESLPPPQPNAEKNDQMYPKVRPFVPPEYQDDLIYAAPTPSEAAQSKDTKRARLKRRADTAAETKRVQDERNSAPSFVDQLQGVMEEIEESERTQSQAKETCASNPKKKARKASSA